MNKAEQYKMNKAEQFRAEMLAAQQQIELEKQFKAKEEEERRAARRAETLPLDIKLAYWIIDNHHNDILLGKRCSTIVEVGHFVYVAEMPDDIRNHKMNQDNLDVITEMLRDDGFKVEIVNPHHSYDDDFISYLKVSW